MLITRIIITHVFTDFSKRNKTINCFLNSCRGIEKGIEHSSLFRKVTVPLFPATNHISDAAGLLTPATKKMEEKLVVGVSLHPLLVMTVVLL